MRENTNAGYAAAAGFLGAAAVYLVAEAVAAAAWSSPSYSYVHNWISTLGACEPSGGSVCSPLRVVMNTAFVLRGVLFVLGSVCAALSLGWVGARVFVTFAIIHALGVGLVGLVPESTPAPVGTLHLVGALFAIAGGNLAITAGGSSTLRRAAPHWFPWASTVLGMVGLTFLVLFGALREVNPGLLRALGAGLVERMSVYTVNAWEIVAGILLLRAARGQRRR
jgi:hypothetical membrane protein